jgi:hypothetical protein
MITFWGAYGRKVPWSLGSVDDRHCDCPSIGSIDKQDLIYKKKRDN